MHTNYPKPETYRQAWLDWLKRKQKVKVQNQKSLHLFTNTARRERCECRKRRNRMDSGEVMWGTPSWKLNARSSSARVEEVPLGVGVLLFCIFGYSFFFGENWSRFMLTAFCCVWQATQMRSKLNLTVLISEINKLNERPATDRHLQQVPNLLQLHLLAFEKDLHEIAF